MKISYVYHFDASRPTVQSGRPAAILTALTEARCAVQRIFPLRDDYRAQRWVQKLFWHALGRQYLFDRHPALLRSYARQVDEALAKESGDVLFSPGTLAISHLESDIPVTFCSDASLAALLDYYPAYSRLSPFLRRTAETSEALALSRAALAIYPSEWAAQSAIDHYGLSADRVAVVPFGANLGSHNTEAEIFEKIEARGFETIRLLFIGREWERKGGDIVLDTARLLMQRGINVQVDIVGPKDAPRFARLPFVRDQGALNPAKPDERTHLADLFKSAHFLFVPSRAEAFGLVFSEASAFGVPVVSTATGGIPGAVRSGVNGHLLPLEAGPEDYANVIRSAVEDPKQYRALAQRSFREFQNRLNWKVFCTSYLNLVRERVLPDKVELANEVGEKAPVSL
jgi:glycosyltransferase involved in cell wall biosynthesis